MPVGDGTALTPDGLWWAWGMDGWSGAPAVALGGAMALGLSRLGPRTRRRVAAPLLAGGLTFGLAAFSPLDALSEALFTAHMVQHLLLLAVVAPLLAAAGPERLLLAALPGKARRRVSGWRTGWFGHLGRWCGSAPVAFAVHAGVLVLWHVPELYGLALRSPAIHALEHATFLGSAVLYWRVLVGPGARPGVVGGFLMLFGMAIVSGVLGALIGFSPRPWIAEYARSTTAFGLTPLEDQQLAGAIMWVPGGFAYAIAALWLLGTTLRKLESGATLSLEGR